MSDMALYTVTMRFEFAQVDYPASADGVLRLWRLDDLQTTMNKEQLFEMTDHLLGRCPIIKFEQPRTSTRGIVIAAYLARADFPTEESRDQMVRYISNRMNEAHAHSHKLFRRAASA